jgi:hypothetical protein
VQPTPRPGGWPLFLALPLIMLLLLLETQAGLPEPIHQLTQVMILIVVLAMVDYWVTRGGPWCCRGG